MIAYSFNFYEAFIWFFVAGISFAYALSRPDKRQKILLLWTVPLWIAFGVSDFVEIQTGAWYRPWWLLAWKSVCVVTNGSLLIFYCIRAKHGGGVATKKR